MRIWNAPGEEVKRQERERAGTGGPPSPSRSMTAAFGLAWLSGAAREAGDDRRQVARIDGLGDVDLKAGQQRLTLVVFADERRQCHRWEVFGVMPTPAHLADQIHAVLIRHAKVADQHIGIRRDERLDGFRGAGRRRDDGARLLKHLDEKPPSVGFIIHY